MEPDVLERFESKIEWIPFSTCWWWNGSIESNGYGRFKAGGRKWSPHRLAYEHWNGQLKDGLEIDHLCRNRSCVNPAHLEQVTHRENSRRGLSGRFNAEKINCSKGHPFSAENTRFNDNRRICMTCNKNASVAWRRQKGIPARAI